MSDKASEPLMPRSDLAAFAADSELRVASENLVQRPQRGWLWRIGYTIGNCIQLLVLGGTLDFLLFFDVDLPFLLRLGLLGVVLFAVSREAVWVVLLALISSLVAREPASRFTAWEFLSLIYCVCSGLVILYTLQADLFRNAISQGFGDGMALIAGNSQVKRRAAPQVTAPHSGVIPKESREVLLEETSNFDEPRITLKDIGIQAVVFAFVALLCMFALDLLPNSTGKRNELFRWTRNDATAMTSALLIGMGVLILLRELSWKLLNTRQAGMFLRSQFVSEYQREFGAFFRRRIKMEKKKARKAKS